MASIIASTGQSDPRRRKPQGFELSAPKPPKPGTPLVVTLVDGSRIEFYANGPDEFGYRMLDADDVPTLLPLVTSVLIGGHGISRAASPETPNTPASHEG